MLELSLWGLYPKKSETHTLALGRMSSTASMAFSPFILSGWLVKKPIIGITTARSVSNSFALELASVPVGSRGVVFVTGISVVAGLVIVSVGVAVVG